ncbi:MAG: ABC transporter ATP-binding protein [Longimicrobiales bacterium]|nr:ABC transporter ATP-binding protein [Longimicrobiales bacterium]
MSEERPEAAVSLTGLTRRFGDNLAVAGLTLDVRPGELFGIVGPDGAGKTTTLRMLAGVLPPSEGKGVIHGVDVATDPEGVKPYIAYMSQQFGLYTDLTVRENIDFYADLYRVPKIERPPRLERLFAFSNLGPFQDRLAGNLSGGMKQKLSLCCALIHHPKVLLLDEPTFGVDPISRRDLWLILHEMVEDGVTVMVSTSYLDEAERCDRVVLLHEGKVLAMDTPSALLDLLPGQVVSVKGPEPRKTRDLIRGMPGVVSTALFGNSVHAVLAEGGEALMRLAEALVVAGLAADKVEPVEPTLEDVFLHLVRAKEVENV